MKHHFHKTLRTFIKSKLKKIFLTAIAVTSLLIYNTTISAEIISLSVGIPISHTIADETVAESDGVSGSFVHAKLPLIPVGLGFESYKTNVKDNAPLKIATTMFDVFYLLPIPIINLTIGAGAGSVNIDGGSGFEKGLATQLYTSVGMPILPLFDIHLSYRSVTAKNTKDGNGNKMDLSGNVAGIGLAFTF